MQLFQLRAPVEVFDETMARRCDLVDLDPESEYVARTKDEDDAQQDPGRLFATTLKPPLRGMGQSGERKFF